MCTPTTVAVRDRERVVDFRRARVVNREGAHLGFGQILEVERGGKRQIRGKAAAAREVLAIEAFDVPRPGALDAAELEHEAQGRHSRVGGRVGAILRELCRRLGQPLLNGGDVQFLTDDAGGCHHKIAGLQTRGCGGQLTHPLCVLMAVGGAGVGIAGIGHDALGLSVFQMVHGDIQRGRLHPVEGVHGGGGALPL